MVNNLMNIFSSRITGKTSLIDAVAKKKNNEKITDKSLRKISEIIIGMKNSYSEYDFKIQIESARSELFSFKNHGVASKIDKVLSIPMCISNMGAEALAKPKTTLANQSEANYNFSHKTEKLYSSLTSLNKKNISHIQPEHTLEDIVIIKKDNDTVSNKTVNEIISRVDRVIDGKTKIEAVKIIEDIQNIVVDNQLKAKSHNKIISGLNNKLCEVNRREEVKPQLVTLESPQKNVVRKISEPEEYFPSLNIIKTILLANLESLHISSKEINKVSEHINKLENMIIPDELTIRIHYVTKLIKTEGNFLSKKQVGNYLIDKLSLSAENIKLAARNLLML